jgi:hypothetical protein
VEPRNPSNPFILKTGDNVSSIWDTHLDFAISDWNFSSVLDLQKVAGGTNPRRCRPTAGRIEVCNAAYGFNGWLGIAQIWINGLHITQATTKVNDSYFNTSTYNKPEWRRLVMCQEIAHDFGLDHQDVNFSNPNLGSCMDYTNDPDGPPSNEHPNQHDFDMLEQIYAHLDSTSTIASAPASLPGNAPPFSQANRANGPRYVDDLGDGQHLVTFVLWTPFGE